MTDIIDHAWYVVQTQVNSELRAVGNLLRQGFETYLPRYRKRRSHARKIEQVAAPLFPRYLFVRVDLATQRWRSIQSTYGVSHLVFIGSEPARIRSDLICALKAREDDSGFVKFDRRAQVPLGAKVRILGGAFTDNLGLFDGLGDRDRVAVLLDLLGRKVRVSLDENMIAAA